MTITINGDDIDFTLENEKTIGDVLAELKRWLGGTGMLVGDIEIDNRKMTFDEKDLFEKPVKEVERLSIEALSVRESKMRQLETARDFFALLRDAAEAGDGDMISKLETSYQDIIKILPQMLGEGPNSSIISGLGKTLEQEPQKLISSTTDMLAILDGRLKEVADPIGEARSAAATLAELAGSLDDVAVSLQTGKDKQAMTAIAELCEILQKFVRCLTWSSGAVKKNAIADDMNKIFSELEKALIANDTVLIGDLLEYEFRPRLTELPNRMNSDVKPI